MLKDSGATRLFQVSGITVFMHWSWLLVAVFEISSRSEAYSSIIWNVLEYLALFGIVTLHEFGHSFACRSVGGKADEILLWPLGGVAIVDPPTRPGATLWSIAAGPLVNVALLPVLGGLALLISNDVSTNLHAFLRSITFINLSMLVFNLLPIYPLDGGQILGSLLWFVFGRARSMMAAAVIGMIGAVGIGLLAVLSLSLWLGLIALFVAGQCRISIHVAKALHKMANGPRRTGVACPSCHQSAPVGQYWPCVSCCATFDVFEPSAGAASEPTMITTLQLSGSPAAATISEGESRCPACYVEAETVRCFTCDSVAPIALWNTSSAASSHFAVTRFRPPRLPSVRPVVVAACAAIAALMVILVGIVAYTASAREVDAATALFMRQVALVVTVFAVVPFGASVWFFVRYQRSHNAFLMESQRFEAQRSQGEYS